MENWQCDDERRGMKIIITNDDGIHSRGLVTLVERLGRDHDILVAGPDSEKSATSHSVTIHEPIVVREVKKGEGLEVYAVQGTPADCVKWAVCESGFKADWIVSGVNRGANTGISVYYSGTVAAAREGAINGLNSLAVSLCSKTFEDFHPATELAAQIVEQFGSTRNDQGKPWLFNLSVPPCVQSEMKGICLAKQAYSKFIEEFIRFEPDQLEKETHARHYQLAGGIHLPHPDGNSDEELVHEGWATLTPLSIDQTDYKILESLREKWGQKKINL